MDFVEHLIVLFHFLGFASLFGGALVQVRSTNPVVNNAMRDGAWTQLITGLVLVVLAEVFGDEPVNNAKIGVKLLVLIGILALVLINRKKQGITRGTLFTVLGLTGLNAAVAVLW